MTVLNGIHGIALKYFQRHFSIENDVLEIGADLAGDVAAHCLGLGARVTALNPSAHFRPPSGITALREDARDIMSAPDAAFDSVISINAFEHIHSLDLALLEIARVLKPGGYLGTIFGPIWTSAQGHHLWAKSGEDIVSFWNPAHRNPVDDYAHLLLSPCEMRRDLSHKGEAPDMIEAIVEAVYRRGDLNRWTYGQYQRAFAHMPLDIIELAPNNRFDIDPFVQDKLESRWGADDFSVSSFRLIARKPG